MIFITSDLHFFHDREFIYAPRGFSSVEEMNNAYLKEWKEKISENDDVYILGDFCLGKDLDKIEALLDELPGKIHLIIGNHDTDKKIELYKSRGIEVNFADRLFYNNRLFFLSHYPTITSNLEENYKKCVINLHGHIHSKNKFYQDMPFVINISVDANNNKILTLDEVLDLFSNKVVECFAYL